MSKITVRKSKKHPYLIMDKTGLQDGKLSWKAKGILAYLLSLPDDRQVYITELVKHSKDWRDSTSAGIKELIENWYIVRSQTKGEKGKFDWYDYDIYEKPVTGNPSTDKPKTGKQTLLSNNKLNNNKTKILSKDNTMSDDIDAPIIDSEKINRWDQKVNNVIELMKKYCKDSWIFYSPGEKERMFAKHLTSEKLAKEIAEQNTDLEWFIKNIIWLSSLLYIKSANSPEKLYHNRPDILNQWNKLSKEEKQKIKDTAKADNAMAYAKSLDKWLREVAIERVTTYESKWQKMDLHKIKERMNWRINKNHWEQYLIKYKEIFIKAEWDLTILWNNETN